MLVNCIYTKEKPIKIGSLGDVWRNENHALSNVEAVFEKHYRWFKEITEGNMD
jgi:hypothetical protein